MEELKLDKNFSLEEIKKQMQSYQKNGQTVCTKINGLEFNSNDPDFEKIFEILSLDLDEIETKEMKGLERDIRVYKGRITNAKKIENNELIRFYYGLAKTMIKPEKISEFETLLTVYPNGRFYNELILFTKITLAFEQEDKLQIFREINQIFSSINSSDDIDLNSVLRWVNKFAIKGSLVNEIFFVGTTQNYINLLTEKIEKNTNIIEEIKKQNKPTMIYKDIVLNGPNGFEFKLIKYNDNYSSLLTNFTNPDKNLINFVKKCPKLYSESSECQSYMILDKEYTCIGIIYIGTSCDELDLEVKLQLDEKKFTNETDIYNTIDQIIDVLGYCYRDKNHIEVNLVNNIDLSKYDPKYQKKIYDKNLTTYIFPNKINGKKRKYKRKI